MAKKWGMYVIKWSQLNAALKSLFIVDINARRTSLIVSRLITALFTATIIGYLLFNIKRIYDFSQCDETNLNATLGETFFQQSFPHIFGIFPYHVTYGIFLLVIESVLRFAPIFNDALIIAVSFMLAKNFKMLNKRFSISGSVRTVSLKINEYFLCFLVRTSRGSFGATTLMLTRNYSSKFH